MFARHPAVATLPIEARFLVDPDGIIDFYDGMRAGWSPYLFDVKVKRLERLLRDVGPGSGIGKVVGQRARKSRAAVGAPSSTAVSSGSAGRIARLGANLSNSAASRWFPRYLTVNLEDSCPSYTVLAEELIRRLVAFRFEGRWTGMSIGEASTLAFGGSDVAEHLRWFCRRLVACICKQQDTTHFVEDTPFNLLSFDRIHALLPESRLVHIHRDPRDVVASYLEKRWSPSDPTSAAMYYVTMMGQWQSIRETLPPDSFLELGMRALVDDTEPTVRKISDFWSLPWDPVVLEVDLSHAHSGRWKQDIPKADQPAVERILAPYLEAYAGPG